MESEMGFFDDDGTEINPNLVPKPSLCFSCKLDNDPKEETLCTLNRMDVDDEFGDFFCGAYQKKDSVDF